MTREEVKEELLNNEEQQFKTTVVAQFATLYEYLVKKGVFTQEDIDEMNKSTKQLVEKLNEVSVDIIMKELNKED